MDPSSGPVGAVCGVTQPSSTVASFGIGYAGSNPHGPDENIRIEDFLQSIRLIGRVIHKLADNKTRTVTHSSLIDSDSKPTAPLPQQKRLQVKE
jgi:hypothetical protein